MPYIGKLHSFPSLNYKKIETLSQSLGKLKRIAKIKLEMPQKIMKICIKGTRQNPKMIYIQYESWKKFGSTSPCFSLICN